MISDFLGVGKGYAPEELEEEWELNKKLIPRQ